MQFEESIQEVGYPAQCLKDMRAWYKAQVESFKANTGGVLESRSIAPSSCAHARVLQGSDAAVLWAWSQAPRKTTTRMVQVPGPELPHTAARRKRKCVVCVFTAH